MENGSKRPAPSRRKTRPDAEANGTPPENIIEAVRLVAAAIERGPNREPTKSERIEKNARTTIA